MRILTALLLISIGCLAQRRQDRHVVIISIDGFPAYALKDKSVPLPTVRRLAAEGVVADAMDVVNPAVTWPNHTSIVTGVTPARHGVIYNGLPKRGSGTEPIRVEPWAEKGDLVTAPTLYDIAHNAGMKTGEVDWVAVFHAPTIDYSFAEVPRGDAPLVKEMLAEGRVSAADLHNFEKANIVWRDEMWTQAAEFMIEKHKPNLLLLHFLTTDSAQHQYGARSLGGNAALTLADTRVGRILQSIRKAGIAGTTSVFIVSDHGFKSYRQSIRPNVLLKKYGLVRGTEARIECDAWAVPEGGTAMVYITDSKRRAELLPKLRTDFAAVPGVAAVLDSHAFDRLGYPKVEDKGRMADLVLVAAEQYAFANGTDGEIVSKVPAGSTPGAHGYLSSDSDMAAVFIASGAGIRKGSNPGRIRNLDVGPTAARLLGLAMPNVQGRVLTEILMD